MNPFSKKSLAGAVLMALREAERARRAAGLDAPMHGEEAGELAWTDREAVALDEFLHTDVGMKVARKFRAVEQAMQRNTLSQRDANAAAQQAAGFAQARTWFLSLTVLRPPQAPEIPADAPKTAEDIRELFAV